MVTAETQIQTAVALNNLARHQIHASSGNTTRNPPRGNIRPNKNSRACPRTESAQSHGTALDSSGSREVPVKGPAGRDCAFRFSSLTGRPSTDCSSAAQLWHPHSSRKHHARYYPGLGSIKSFSYTVFPLQRRLIYIIARPNESCFDRASQV